jgi:hypothetical protein
VSKHRGLVVRGAVGMLLAIAAVSPALAAVQIATLSAQVVVPGTVVTMQVAMTGRTAGTGPAPLFMIPSGTWGDSPDSLPCDQVGRAIEVGQTHWQAGAVEFEGATYEGVIGASTFTVPAVPPDTYRLAETIDARGTGCHVFTTLQVVAELPDTALARDMSWPTIGLPWSPAR